MTSILIIAQALVYIRMICGAALPPVAKRSRIIPTKENPPPLPSSIVFSNLRNISGNDELIIRSHRKTIHLAWMMGCDIAIHRDGKPQEWMIPGGQPSSDRGFIVVRNGDA